MRRALSLCSGNVNSVRRREYGARIQRVRRIHVASPTADCATYSRLCTASFQCWKGCPSTCRQKAEQAIREIAATYHYLTSLFQYDLSHLDKLRASSRYDFGTFRPPPSSTLRSWFAQLSGMAGLGILMVNLYTAIHKRRLRAPHSRHRSFFSASKYLPSGATAPI